MARDHSNNGNGSGNGTGSGNGNGGNGVAGTHDDTSFLSLLSATVQQHQHSLVAATSSAAFAQITASSTTVAGTLGSSGAAGAAGSASDAALADLQSMFAGAAPLAPSSQASAAGAGFGSGSGAMSAPAPAPAAPTLPGLDTNEHVNTLLQSVAPDKIAYVTQLFRQLQEGDIDQKYFVSETTVLIEEAAQAKAEQMENKRALDSGSSAASKRQRLDSNANSSNAASAGSLPYFPQFYAGQNQSAQVMQNQPNWARTHAMNAGLGSSAATAGAAMRRSMQGNNPISSMAGFSQPSDPQSSPSTSHQQSPQQSFSGLPGQQRLAPHPQPMITLQLPTATSGSGSGSIQLPSLAPAQPARQKAPQVDASRMDVDSMMDVTSYGGVDLREEEYTMADTLGSHTLATGSFSEQPFLNPQAVSRHVQQVGEWLSG
ncbi:hypothetical protein BC831DRAFT_245814 [Entophlyctis helioformis]|nr:hypothetical protein BC831DRAFT_245814 [Entophlyctis helioformis]